MKYHLLNGTCLPPACRTGRDRQAIGRGVNTRGLISATIGRNLPKRRSSKQRTPQAHETGAWVVSPPEAIKPTACKNEPGCLAPTSNRVMKNSSTGHCEAISAEAISFFDTDSRIEIASLHSQGLWRSVFQQPANRETPVDQHSSISTGQHLSKKIKRYGLKA